MLENVRDFIAVRDEHAARGGNRCRVTFQLTFMEVNYAELPEVVKLVAGLGVDRVKGHHLWAHFSQIQNQSMRRSPEAIARWNATVDAAYAAAERYRLPGGGKVLLDNIFRLDAADNGEIAANAECPFLGQEAWVASDGRFNPCCAPDALRRTLGDFGNLNHASLYDIWQSAAYSDLQSGYMEKPLCRGMQHEEADGHVTDDWREYRIAPGGSHHVCDGKPVYAARFIEVLKFHAPGLAPVLDASGAYHITPGGQPAYESRYVRTFGFYEGRAAVHSAGRMVSRTAGRQPPVP